MTGLDWRVPQGARIVIGTTVITFLKASKINFAAPAEVRLKDLLILPSGPPKTCGKTPRNCGGASQTGNLDKNQPERQDKRKRDLGDSKN
jgi:hypothetical protein